MKLEVDKSPELDERISRLDSPLPDDVSILPHIMDVQGDEQPVYGENAITLRKQIEEKGINYTSLDIEDEAPVLANYSIENFTPILLIGTEFILEHREEFMLLFKTLAIFYNSRVANDNEVELEIIHKDSDGSLTQFKYKGEPKKLEEVPGKMLPKIEED